MKVLGVGMGLRSFILSSFSELLVVLNIFLKSIALIDTQLFPGKTGLIGK